MKHLKLLLLLLIPLLLTSCFTKKDYTKSLISGEFISEEPFSFKKKDYTGIKLIVKEITKDEFSLSKKENTLQDFSLSLEERKYYSVQFYLLVDQDEIPVSMHFYKKCNPYATGPDVYIIKLDLPNEEIITSFSADFMISDWGVSDTTQERFCYRLYFYDSGENVFADFKLISDNVA
ncbi:MAG: hypothetical protein K2O22_03630 [Anaeroplasmataceae bacterium]|nr:hypothetical protein [Anaeroplasmataceae bacterium]